MEDREWDQYCADACYECTGYGDDYYVDENGELQCSCDDCWVKAMEDDD